MEAMAVIEPMTLDEARRCVSEIRSSMANVRFLLLDLDEREGWRVLGYASWRECAKNEFGYEKTHAYQLLNAAKVERNLSAIAEIPTSIPETYLRPLTGLQPEIQRKVYDTAVATAPQGKLTAAHILHTIVVLHGTSGTLAQRSKAMLEDEGDIPPTVTLRVARIVYLLTMGKWMSIHEIAEKTGLTENGAWRLMDRLAGGYHVPVTENEGKWGIPDGEAKDWVY